MSHSHSPASSRQVPQRVTAVQAWIQIAVCRISAEAPRNRRTQPSQRECASSGRSPGIYLDPARRTLVQLHLHRLQTERGGSGVGDESTNTRSPPSSRCSTAVGLIASRQLRQPGMPRRRRTAVQSLMAGMHRTLACRQHTNAGSGCGFGSAVSSLRCTTEIGSAQGPTPEVHRRVQPSTSTW